jgi:alpha-1,2-mannosyltransferase
MTIADRVRSFAAKAAPDPADRPRVDVPSWLLTPGLIVLGLSLIGYVQFVRAYPQTGFDLTMYRGALHAFADGLPVYKHGFFDGLPYTYPPITLPALLPLIVGQSITPAHDGLVLVGILAMMIILWLTTKMLGYRGNAGRLGIVAMTGGVMLWTEPYWWNFDLGQINLLVLLPIVIDLALPDRSRFKGIGIGIATASKLLPGLFIVYLLITRRVRAAVVSVVTFVGLTTIGWIMRPGDSWDYWIRGMAFDSHRVLGPGGPRYVGNQSLQGFVTRLLGIDEQNSVAWILALLVTLAGGLAVAYLAQRRGEEAMAMVVVGYTALLISPISWSHYWLWCAPMTIVLADVARRTAGALRHVAIVVTFAALAPFLMWPSHYQGPLSLHGLIWLSGLHHGVVKEVLADPYVPTVLLLFVVAALWLRHQPALVTPPVEAPAEQADVPAATADVPAPRSEQVEPVAADH